MSATQTNDAPPEPGSHRRGLLWDGMLPEALGLCLVAIIFGGLAAGYLVTDYSWKQQSAAAHKAETEAVAQAMATALGCVADADGRSRAGEAPDVAAGPRTGRPSEQVELLMRELGRLPGLRSMHWTREGEAPAEPYREGEAPAEPYWEGEAPAEPRRDCSMVVTVAVRTLGGEPAGELRVERSASADAGYRSLLLWNWGTPTGITLLVFVALYRRLKRHLRPMVAIERNLHSCAQGLEQELQTLTLSDSLGRAAQGWNHLIEQLTQLHQRLQEAQGAEQADVMARFEGAVFRRVVDRLPIGVICVTNSHTISYANASAAALLQRGPDELVGRAVDKAIENPAVMQAVVAAQARSGAGLSVDHTSRDGDQETTLRFRILPVSAQSPSGDALITVEDISQLREGERARDNFLYHVTHELRTPLTNISAYVETLTQPGFDDEQTRKECYNVIVSETKRLSSLIENILTVSQLEVGTARLDVGEVDLTRLVRQMVQDNLAAADEKRIDLTLSLPPKVPKMRGDKQRLCILLNNLIGNAVKYTPAGGQVQVNLEVAENRLVLAVSDTGIGIAAEDQAQVFDKFYRATADAVQAVPGTGLGLALAREVARLHGGEIHLESELGQGSTFTIELPWPTSDQKVTR
ncbi:MAG: PAS domain-containing protein [Phycisphaerae bacterium]|nr:PAS domain-containing protein [Phycisphaerae bacterium]